MDDKKLYTVTEVAARAGVSGATMYSWLKAGRVKEPGKTISGRRRFTEEEVKKIIELIPTEK